MMKKKVIFLLLFLNIFISYAQTYEIADKYWEEANAAAEQKDLMKAAELFEKSALAEKASEAPRQQDLQAALGEASNYHWQINNREKALTFRKKALAISQQCYGANHDVVRTHLGWLGHIYYTMGHFGDAIQYYGELLDNIVSYLGNEHIQYGNIANHLANTYYSKQEYDKALPLYLEAIENGRINLGEDNNEYGVRLHNLANLYYYQKNNNDKAIPLYITALEITEKNLGKDHPNYGQYANNLANAYYSKQEYDKALPLYLEAVENGRINLGEDNNEYGVRLHSLANLYYYQKNDGDKALPLYITALEITGNTLGKEHPNYGHYANNLANVYYSTQEYDIALPLYLKALENAEKNLDKNHPDYGTRLNNLANLYQDMGQYDKALPLYLEALENVAKSLGKDCSEYGVRLNNLANLYNEMGQYDKALPLYLEALANTEKSLGKDHSYYRTRLNNLALLYQRMGQYDKAVPLYLETLENAEKSLGKDHSDYSVYLNNLANLYNKMGQYDKALPLFLKALENTGKSLGKGHSYYGSRLNNLANLYVDIGQYDKALSLYLEALQNAEQSLGKDHSEYGIRLNNLAALRTDMGQYDKALPLYLEALENTEKSLGKDHFYYGIRLNNLASLYSQMEQNDKALPLYLKALENTEKSLGKDHSRYGTSLNNLASLYARQGQYDRALPLYLEAFKNAEKSLGKDHPNYGSSLRNMADLYVRMGKYDKAHPFFIQGTENLKNQIIRNFTFLSETEKEHFIKMVGHYFEMYQSFFTDYYIQDISTAETSYDVELLTKGLILSSSQQMRQIIEQTDQPEVIALYDQWFLQKSQIAKQYALPISERASELKQWEADAENIEKELIKYSNAFTDASQLGKITWQDVQNKLSDNEVAIEFASFSYYNGKKWTDTIQYTALLLRKEDKQPQLIPLFTQAELDEILSLSGNERSVINGLYRGSDAVSVQQDLVKLYDLIWEPLEDFLIEGQTIYFAPSGTLHQIAFSAVKNKDGKFLSDVYDLKQVSTTAKILQKDSSPQLNNITLFGGIDYNVTTDDLLIAAQSIDDKDAFVSRSLTTDLNRGGESWSYLHGTLTEVDNIKAKAAHAQIKVSYHTGKTALEEYFKALSGKNSPNILHIATHGFFFPDPEISKEELERMKIIGEQQNMFKLSDNPLNRSGLLFAGANHTWKGEKQPVDLEDGILTAYEASHVSLPHTALVVLSACETGLGDIKGSEGVFGLQRAFKAAGADYLLMSLWQVPDKETAEFMEEFYQNLFDSKNIEKSFSDTQRYMKTKYPDDPYSWAAFVLLK